METTWCSLFLRHPSWLLLLPWVTGPQHQLWLTADLRGLHWNAREHNRLRWRLSRSRGSIALALYTGWAFWVGGWGGGMEQARAGEGGGNRLFNMSHQVWLTLIKEQKGSEIILRNLTCSWLAEFPAPEKKKSFCFLYCESMIAIRGIS